MMMMLEWWWCYSDDDFDFVGGRYLWQSPSHESAGGNTQNTYDEDDHTYVYIYLYIGDDH